MEGLLQEVTLGLDPSPFFGEMREVASGFDAAITVEDCSLSGSKRMMLRVNIDAPKWNAGKIVAALRKRPSVKRVYASAGKKAKSSCIIVLDQPRICKATRKAGIFCLTCAYNTAGTDEGWRLLAKSSHAMRKLLDQLKDEGVAVTIKGESTVSKGIELTSRQSEVVAKAASLGYFDFPRKKDSHYVAKALGIKPATFSEIMRAAERKMVERYIRAVRSKSAGTVGPRRTGKQD